MGSFSSSTIICGHLLTEWAPNYLPTYAAICHSQSENDPTINHSGETEKNTQVPTSQFMLGSKFDSWAIIAFYKHSTNIYVAAPGVRLKTLIFCCCCCCCPLSMFPNNDISRSSSSRWRTGQRAKHYPAF